MTAEVRQTAAALGHVPGTAHPLLGADDQQPAQLDVLPLRDWISISGAAIGPGMGQFTSAALSVLFLLANVRTGYWWNSGLSAGDRGTRPKVSFVRRVLWLLPKLFETQDCFVNEALSRFRGPWDRFWYLSDGGHFENLGAYELIRRRVPLIILVDAGADPNYNLDDLANLQRKVRLDFQTELVPLGEREWESAVDRILEKLPKEPDTVVDTARNIWNARKAQVELATEEGGPLHQLLAKRDGGRLGTVVEKHAALLRVRYHGSRDGLLLYVKASLSGDESTDVLNYHLGCPDFPFESTANQFFGEAQWESYRRLGEHVGDMILGAGSENVSSDNSLWLKELLSGMDPSY
jgi:hypothetical protein